MAAGQCQQPAAVDRLDRSRAATADLQHRRSVGERRAVGACGRRQHRGEDPRARVRDLPSDRDGSQTVDEAVEIDEEQHHARGDGHPGDRDPDCRHVRLFHVPQQREREGERPDERAQHRFLQPVAIPQAHEPRGEGLGRHLDDQHAERHHEARQSHHRAHDRAEHRARRRLGVLPRVRQVDDTVEHDRQLGEQRTRHGAPQRHDPEAAHQPLAPAEASRPRPARNGRARGERCHDAIFAAETFGTIPRFR